ncbi:PAS domain S-box-containing protein [Breznakibacter xylanolyticus]|uniref:histidine kinase n=2 Tax=Breznakibacter xylanolyticus TaxID=990 RepID=A0A2W7N5N0_9BACT|nr:PAS domain S-box-containing protein [Breznakibacter xylanolyticus]
MYELGVGEEIMETITLPHIRRHRMINFKNLIRITIGLFMMAVLSYAILPATPLLVFGNFFFLACSGMAFGILLYVWQHPQTPSDYRSSLKFFSLSMFFWFMGDLLWLFNELIWHLETDPSLADIGYLMNYPFIIAGVWALPNMEKSAFYRRKALNELIMILICTAVIFWYLVVYPFFVSQQEDIIKTLLVIAYPLGDILVFWSIVMLLYKYPLRMANRAIRLMVVALSIVVVTDIAYTALSYQDTYDTGDWIDLGYFAFYFLMSLSALSIKDQREENEHGTVHVGMSHQEWVTYIPYAFCLLLYGLLFYLFYTNSTANMAILYIGGLSLLLLQVRHMRLIYVDHKSLTKEILFFNQHLEHKVIERTQDLYQLNQKLYNEIQEHIQTEKNLRESEQRFRTLVETSPYGIALCSIDGYWIMSNHQGAISLGYHNAEAMIGKKAIRHVEESDRKYVHEEFLKLHQQSNPVCLILNIVRTDRFTIPLEVSATMIRDEHGLPKMILIISRDLTELRLTGELLKYKNQELENLNKEKDKLFSIIAHDLRSPFFSIIGLLDILLKKQNLLNEQERHEYLEMVKNSAQETLTMIENLLEWSRVQQNHLAIKKTPLKVNEMVGEVIRTVAPTATLKRIHIDTEIAENLEVQGDPNMLRTVFRNFVGNALKFTHPDGVITITAQHHTSNTEIIVSDTGVGIEADKLDTLFSGTISGTTRGTMGEKGTGLGLSLCKDLIERHGGKVWVESQPGKGSRFGFSLPNLSN